jgi:tRNA-dihydrouridine synthase B
MLSFRCMMVQCDSLQPKLMMAPLQGFTEAAYREAFHNCFGTIDAYYAPYVTLNKHMEPDGLKDLMVQMPENMNLVPQVLAASLPELSVLLKSISHLGYTQVNLNMGCPYPMVTRKGRGAALIRNPALVKQMIELVYSETDLKLSIKVRSGMEKENELLSLLSQLPLEKLDAIILHPRTAAQRYHGTANTDVAVQCVKDYPNVTWIYNGDIVSYRVYEEKQALLPGVQQWMIGRGLLENPFLAGQIRQQTDTLPTGWEKQLAGFMKTLVGCLIKDSHDEWHALNRSKIQLTQLLIGFPMYKKERKQMGKCRSMQELNLLINQMEQRA